ncbi:MAG: helix-turn-helix transcriptional regulator [Clostridia bacterium]|nr:helix-turn-helix transcriptional regulator [Clostridia bacterium]
MTIGEKIRYIRKEKGMTQARVASGCVSRNMLSLVEQDKVQPSLDTLRHIADVLGVCIGYFLDEEDDLFFYEKKKRIGKIKDLFSSRKFNVCLSEIKKLKQTDDETAYIAASCATELGLACVKNGNMTQGASLLREAQSYTEKTVYDTASQRIAIALYLPIADNVQSPLLEFDDAQYTALSEAVTNVHLYKYLMQDTEHTYPPGRYADHMIAKALMRERRYADAVLRLHRIEDTRSNEAYDAFLFFGVYTDLELCYKELYDFEKAYRYASKRMSLLESFRS